MYNCSPHISRQTKCSRKSIVDQIPFTMNREWEKIGQRVKVPLSQRLFEIAVSSTILIIFSPVMLLTGIYIMKGTPGPAIFKQKRLGKNCKEFTFYKYRTFFVDAKERFPELYAYSYSQDEYRNMKFKIDQDPRVTKQGRWLRKSTLDELPNFWNVLKGDIALVGPRPELPEMLEYYNNGYERREAFRQKMMRKFDVRPGLTGLAQISGRGDLSFVDSVALDVMYVENRCLLLDIKILFYTLLKVFKADGAF